MTSDFSIDCECGTQLPVSASQAGATIECRCGRTLKIPLLSQLRRRQGKRAYESGPIETIERLIAEGKLPTSDMCVISGRPTKDVCRLEVHCEKLWLKTQGLGLIRYVLILFYVLYPIFALIHLITSRSDLDSDAVVHGRDRGVDVVLRLDQEFHAQVRRYSQRALKKLLLNEPAYEALLKEYPAATIRVTY